MEKIIQALTGLIWSIEQLQKLIPSGKEWDNKAQAIFDHKRYAQKELDFLNCQRFPYKAIIIENRKEFTPTMIDFDNKMVWNQKSQVSGDGEWIQFEDIELHPNPYFKLN